MLKKISIWLTAFVMLTACGQNHSQTVDPNSSDPTKDGKHFGAIITPDDAIPYSDVMAKMESVDSLNMKVMGVVHEVCQMKGCWMTLITDKPDYPEMRVTFKDYAFFMPKDLSGKKVVIDGYAYVDETSVDMLRHYAEDAGKSEEEIKAITEPKKEVSFEASGVVIVD